MTTTPDPVRSDSVTPMERSSYLIQRLSRPFHAPEGTLLAKLGDNPFAFGGGLVNGGLSKAAMAALRDVFRFDYMGASEFEWGAVPKALDAIARAHATLRAWSIEIPYARVEPDWRDKRPAPDGSGRVFIICPAGWSEEVERRIRHLAEDGPKARLKEMTHLNLALRPGEDWQPDVCGWLELDNGFLFFTDEQMFEQAASLLGVVPEKVAP